MPQEYRNLSFWHDTVPGALEPRPALDGDHRADVVIVGAGYTGLWTAWYLKQAAPALDITVLEAEIAGFGASGRNGGWCSGYLSGIEHWLEHPPTREAAIRLQRLMFDTVGEVGAFCREEAVDCHFEHSGALEIAVIPAQLERLREELAFLRRFGFDDGDYRWLERAEMAGALRVADAEAAIHMSHCAAVHPSRLARGLAEAVERRGVRICEQSPVTRIDGQRAVTPTGTVTADAVLVATEGYSASIAGRGRRLIPVHSMMVVTEPLTDAQRELVGANRRYCFGNIDHLVTYGQATADGRIAFGCRGGYHYGSGIRRFDPGNPEFGIVRQTLLRFFPSLRDVSFSHAWGGAMGVSRNLRPSVNFDRERRFGWAGGYFGNGVGAAHLAGRTLADLVLEQHNERTSTPWVNPPDAGRRWEPEPLRWLGIQSRARLMHWADRAEYRGRRSARWIRKSLETLFP